MFYQLATIIVNIDYQLNVSSVLNVIREYLTHFVERFYFPLDKERTKLKSVYTSEN